MGAYSNYSTLHSKSRCRQQVSGWVLLCGNEAIFRKMSGVPDLVCDIVCQSLVLQTTNGERSRCLVPWLRCYLGCPCPRGSRFGLQLWLWPTSCWCACGDTTDKDLSPCVPATHVGDLTRVSGCCLWPGSVLSDAGIWCTESSHERSLLVSLP